MLNIIQQNFHKRSNAECVKTRLKGNFQGGTLTYGYKLDGRKIVIDEQKAETVRYIFNRYAHGHYVSEIVKELTLHGITYKGKPIPQNMIYNMLKNEKYTGIYKRNNEIYENMFPKIIEQEIFDKVSAKKNKNLYGKRSTRAVYLLRNKLICGYCGKPISAESGTSEHGKKINYYKCKGIKQYKNGCIKETIRQDVLENLVIEVIIKELSRKENIDKIVKNLIEMQKAEDYSTELKILMKSKKQAENTLNNIMVAIEQGIINKTTNRRMKELETQIEELEKAILIEKNKNNLQLGEDDIRNYYIKVLQQEPAMLIEYLIKEIKMFNDKIEITFNNPIKKGPKNSDLSLLLDTYSKTIIQNRNENKEIEIKIELYI